MDEEWLDLPPLAEADQDLSPEDDIDLAQFTLALAEERSGTGTPPNLREQESNDTRCGSCVHYDGEDTGTCQLYRYPVRIDQVCDDYEARVEDQDASDYTSPDDL